MSAESLLAELEAAGIHVIRQGDNLRFCGEASIRLAPYTEWIREHKPELLAALHDRAAPERDDAQRLASQLTRERSRRRDSTRR